MTCPPRVRPDPGGDRGRSGAAGAAAAVDPGAGRPAGGVADHRRRGLRPVARRGLRPWTSRGGDVRQRHAPPLTDERPATSPLRPRPLWDSLYQPLVMSDLRRDFDFRPGVPDASRFPYSTWRALITEQLRPGAVGSAAHIDPAGVGALRIAIARHVGVARAVRAVAGRRLRHQRKSAGDRPDRPGPARPGTRVAMEDPGYLPMRGRSREGAQVVGCPSTPRAS